MFRGNSQATGIAAGSLAEKPQLLWKLEVEKGAFESTPVVADGVVFVGDLDGVFYALDLTTGKEKWRFKNPSGASGGFNAAAAVRDGLVYVGDMEGTFFCFDAASGEQKWAVRSEAEINSGANFYKDNVLFGSQDATLYCLNAKTGKEVWKHTIGDQIRCSPTVVENRCFLAGCDGKLHIVNLDTGEAVGSVPIESPTGSTPAASGDVIYFGTEGATFFCIDWKQATVVWKWQDRAKNLPLRSSAAITPGAIIFGGRDKLLHALNPQDGKPLWDFATKGRIDGSPVVVGTRAFFGSADGRVYAVDVKTGGKLWEYEAGGSFVGSPAIAQGK